MAQSGYRILSCFYKTNSRLLNSGFTDHVFVTQVRGRKRWHRSLYKAFYWRRIEQGPEPERPRSAWINWNYDAEIFALGQRLKEDFTETTLKRALTHSSYIQKEKVLRKDLEMGDEVHLEDNRELVKKGEEFTNDYVKAYLRHSFPALPEEGICSISEYLQSDEMLAEIGRNIGIKDLILCAEFPPSTATLSQSLKAMIGGLVQDQGSHTAEHFVQDFIITMMVGKDVMEMWEIVNPMGVLQSVIQKQQHGDIESRLLYETGANTVLATYMVGVYSDKKLLGKGYGETLSIAEEMAARDALRKFFGITLNQEPLPFNEDGHRLEIDHRKINASIKDYLTPSQLQ